MFWVRSQTINNRDLFKMALTLISFSPKQNSNLFLFITFLPIVSFGPFIHMIALRITPGMDLFGCPDTHLENPAT